MWLIFCIVLLYWSAGAAILYNLDRGDYECFDRHERKILGWAPDRGCLREDFADDRRETVKMIAVLTWVWPFLIYIYYNEMNDARKELAKKTANR
jgi:hypothetical protein